MIMVLVFTYLSNTNCLEVYYHLSFLTQNLKRRKPKMNDTLKKLVCEIIWISFWNGSKGLGYIRFTKHTAVHSLRKGPENGALPTLHYTNPPLQHVHIDSVYFWNPAYAHALNGILFITLSTTCGLFLTGLISKSYLRLLRLITENYIK